MIIKPWLLFSLTSAIFNTINSITTKLGLQYTEVVSFTSYYLAVSVVLIFLFNIYQGYQFTFSKWYIFNRYDNGYCPFGPK